MAREDISQFPKHRNTGIRLIMLDLQGVDNAGNLSFSLRGHYEVNVIIKVLLNTSKANNKPVKKSLVKQ